MRKFSVDKSPSPQKEEKNANKIVTVLNMLNVFKYTHVNTSSILS